MPILPLSAQGILIDNSQMIISSRKENATITPISILTAHANIKDGKPDMNMNNCMESLQQWVQQHNITKVNINADDMNSYLKFVTSKYNHNSITIPAMEQLSSVVKTWSILSQRSSLKDKAWSILSQRKSLKNKHKEEFVKIWTVFLEVESYQKWAVKHRHEIQNQSADALKIQTNFTTDKTIIVIGDIHGSFKHVTKIFIK
eukprot:351215_1